MAEEKKKLIVSISPHIRDEKTSSNMMRDVIIALAPAALGAIFFFGVKALALILASISAALFSEWVMLRIRKKKPVFPDFASAVLTGLLLALIVSPAIPWWMVVVGSAISIIIAKHLFGGLGYNIFNPALVGRAFILASWPLIMTRWLQPFDKLTTATPLAVVKSQFNPDAALRINPLGFPSLSFLVGDPKMALTNMSEHLSAYWHLFLGNYGGCIGETSALLLLIGAAFLFIRKVIDWRIPLSYVSTVFILSALFGQDPIFSILAGGLMLGAFFMATDPVTTPVTKPGRWIFGIGAGVIVVIIRLFGGYPEGVCYSILLMNAATPLLDRYAIGRRFGT